MRHPHRYVVLRGARPDRSPNVGQPARESMPFGSFSPMSSHDNPPAAGQQVCVSHRAPQGLAMPTIRRFGRPDPAVCLLWLPIVPHRVSAVRGRGVQDTAESRVSRCPPGRGVVGGRADLGDERMPGVGPRCHDMTADLLCPAGLLRQHSRSDA